MDKEKMNANINIPYSKLKDWLNAIPYACICLNEAGEIIEVNEICLHAFGRSEQELIGVRIERLLPDVRISDHETPSYLSWVDPAKQSRKTRNCRMPFETEGGIKGYILHLFDVGKDFRNNFLQRFAQQLFSDRHNGIILVDASARICGISEMACQIFDIERKDVLFAKINELPPNISHELQILEQTLYEGVPRWNHAVSLKINNQRVELLVDIQRICDRQKRCVGAYMLFKNMTNFRSLEEQIRRNEQLAMIGQIAAGTAHEIRNPLTSIKGFLQILDKTAHEKELSKEKEYIEIMLKELEHINELVSEFLLLSKPKDTTFRPVNIQEVMQHLKPIIETQAIMWNIKVEWDIPQLPDIIADFELLKQLFLNLGKNGIEAMGEGGVLKFRAYQKSNDLLCVEVHDTGPGIPAYVMDKIFDPFFTTKQDGTGLGLSICQRLVHDMGGTIRVHTKGYGTIFEVLFPIQL